MLSNHKLQATLTELKEISRVDMALFEPGGRMVAATCTVEEDMALSVSAFAQSQADTQSVAHHHFFKVMVEDQMEYVLLLWAVGEETYVFGRLIACQLRNLILAYRDQFDRDNFMQNVLLGNMLVVDLYNKAKRLHIEPARRVVYVIDLAGKKEPFILQLVKQAFVQNGDFLTEVDENTVVLIKDCTGLREEEELDHLAAQMVDTLQVEAMIPVRVGFGNPVELLQDLSRSYQEAKMALEVGSIFYVEKKALSYRNLGIGRLICQLPLSLCEMFLQEVFGERIPDIFDEESQVTIQKFFENNLNISETARQLYVHRNTLVYRLERIEKTVGLDIRTFENAMLFKIALMVLAHMQSLQEKDLGQR